MNGAKKTANWKRKNLHLDENTAYQVRMQALRWGLNETQTIKQLLHVGLQAASNSSVHSEQTETEIRALRMIFRQLLNLQVETLLYQREAAADVALLQRRNVLKPEQKSGPEGGVLDHQRSRQEVLVELDKRVRDQARRASREMREVIELEAGLARRDEASAAGS